MTVPERHQRKVARDTLKLSVAGSRIMGGMSFEDAYELIYNTPLRPRLEQLLAEYGENGPWSWELEQHGHTPAELLKEIYN